MAEGKQGDPNLYLVGFMGTGKSMVGRLLARRLKMQFLDSDQQIEAKEGMPITRIFEEKGEACFRMLERQFIMEGHPERGCIVSCGGGLVIQPGMIEELKKRGLIACLFATPETILKRTQGHSHRPLLNVPDPLTKIRTLLAEREPIYLKAGTCIMTDKRPLPDVLNHLTRFYRREAKQFRKKRACI